MYSVTKLNTVAECASLLNIALSEQDALEFRKTSITRRAASYAGNEAEIDADIAAAQAELNGVIATIAILVDGKKKDDTMMDKERLEYHLKVLNHKKKNVGSVAVLDNELEVANINVRLDNIATFITEVEARKAQL